jgi:hypothetical protein
MAKDLAELQDDAIARGYTHDFGNDEWRPFVSKSDLHVVGSVSLDGGTDPGDDVTMYLIEARHEKGYLLLSDSFHNNPKKTAFINSLLRGGGVIN